MATTASSLTATPVLLIRAARPKQWVKNGFVVLPALFAQELGEWASLLTIVAAVACFCLASSAVYLVNDVLDRAEDRVHPRKRLRPVASGALSVSSAIAAAAGLFIVAVVAGVFIGWAFAAVLLAYATVSLSYSVWLKHEVLLDVMAIAAGFVLRVVAGAVAIDVRPSDWILICTGLLALMLGFAKRRGEVLALAERGADHRRVLADYTVSFLDAMLYFTAAITVAAYAIYTTSGIPAEHYLVITLPLVLYGVIRYLWLAICRDMGESPTAVMWTDRPVQVCVVSWAILSGILLAV